jgi:hypothetical protein
VTLVPPAEDREQVKVLRLPRDQIELTHLLPDTIYRVKRNRNGDIQLLLQVQDRWGSYQLRVLVETGAHANLVRRGLHPERLFAPPNDHCILALPAFKGWKGDSVKCSCISA